jgi:cell division inhibitor SulA
MAAVDATAGAAVPSLDALLSAQTVWRAGRAPALAAGGEPTGHAGLDALLPQGGWPRRALTELLLPADGVGELSLLLPTLARMTQAGRVVAVVAPPYLPYAPAWQAAGVDLRRLEVIDADARNALWAFEQCLRSAACGAVLGWPLHADAQALRRLQVAADSGDCLGFAFRDRKHAANPSPAALRLEHVDGAWHVRKCRGGNVPARAFPTALVGAASAASSWLPPLRRQGRVGEGCLPDHREPWAPPPNLPLPSQGEEPRQKLAAEAAPTKANPARAVPAKVALAGLR